jgi:HD-like signal output (HDOD) protein
MGWWDWLFRKISQSDPKAPKERVLTESKVAAATATALTRSQDKSRLEPSDLETAPWWMPGEGTLIDPVDLTAADCKHPVEFLENILVSHFDGHDLSMPTLNQTAEQILPKLRTDSCDMKAVAREIAADQVLSAAVLRTVNSPMYRGLANTTTVSAAVARIGIKALRAILLHQSVRGAIFTKNSLTRHFANVLWRKSLADSCIMRGLGGLLRRDQDECHLIGLMHDIGSVLVLRILNDQIKAGSHPVDLNSFEYLCQQTHQEFGELIAKAWQLPSELTQLIMNHRRYPLPNEALAAHRWMLVLTEMIGGMLYAENPRSYDLIHCRPAVELQLSESEQYKTWLSHLPAEIDEVLRDSET